MTPSTIAHTWILGVGLLHGKYSNWELPWCKSDALPTEPTCSVLLLHVPPRLAQCPSIFHPVSVWREEKQLLWNSCYSQAASVVIVACITLRFAYCARYTVARSLTPRVTVTAQKDMWAHCIVANFSNISTRKLTSGSCDHLYLLY
jgi:hypothetical protein